MFPNKLGHREPFQHENNIHDEEAIARLLEFGKVCRKDEMQA
jgi:hypothetical protein